MKKTFIWFITLLILGCAKNERDSAPQYVAAPNNPAKTLQQVWEELQAGLRQSPDHTAARAAAVVQTKDPKAIFNFVRDNITVYPAGKGQLGDLVTGSVWGVRGTLRSGAGTPRDQADLLAALLTQAGFPARVVYNELPPDRRNLRPVFLRANTREFAPAISEATAHTWANSLGVPYEKQAPAIIDPGDDKARKLTEVLFAQAATQSEVLKATNWEEASSFPYVEVKIAGNTRQLTPLFRDIQFDTPFHIDRPGDGPTVVLPKVKVSLWAKRSGTGEKVPLVNGEFSTEDLVGRKVAIQFNPVANLKTLMKARLDELRVFLPTLSVIDSHDASIAARFGNVGPAVSPYFETVQADDQGNVILNGVSSVNIEGEPSLISKVKTIDLSVNALTYPDVKVGVIARDAGGNVIEGLPKSAFQVQDEDATQSALLLKNRPEAPRVLILYDGSGSLPNEFEGAGAVKVGLTIRDMIRANYPNAQFRVMSAGDQAYDLGPWTESRDALQNQLGQLKGVSSDLWTSLAQSRQVRPSLTIFVTDGAVQDNNKLTPGMRTRIAAGTPVITLGVGKVEGTEQTFLDAVARLTGGVSHVIASPEEVSLPLFDRFLDQTFAHRLSYRTESRTQTPHPVVVKVGSIVAKTSYTPPPLEDRGAASTWAGLYLTVTMDRETITRTLVGLEATSRDTSVGAETAAEIDAALFGRYYVAFEGGAPAPSVIMDDILAENLSLIPGLDAIPRGGPALLEALEKGFQRTPEVLGIFTGIPTPKNQDVLTYEVGLRVVGYYEIPKFNAGLVEKVDIFPFPNVTSVSDRVDTSLKGTIFHGVQLGIAEAHLYEKSTVKALGNVTYKTVKLADMPDGATPELALQWKTLNEIYRENIYARAIMPVNAAPVAFWLMDRRTGTTTAILPDGTGGGAQSDTEKQLRSNIFFMEALQKAFSAFGSPLSPWIGLHIAQAKVAAYCTLMIENMDNPNFVPPKDLDPENVAKKYICGQIDRAVSKLFPQQLRDAEKFFKMITGGKSLIPSVCDGLSSSK
jgi:hypothetical protein